MACPCKSRWPPSGVLRLMRNRSYLQEKDLIKPRIVATNNYNCSTGKPCNGRHLKELTS